MTAPKRHRPGWLRHMFSTVAAVTLAASATVAFAQDNDAPEMGADLDAATITAMADATQQTTAPALLGEVCSGADIVLVGDTDHASLPVQNAMYGPATMDALVECGVGTVFIELSSGFQPELDKFMSGAIEMDELREKYLAFVSNSHNMSDAEYAAKRETDLKLFDYAKSVGLKLVAADPQNGAGEGFMIGLIMHGAFNKIKQGLPEEFQPYHDLFLDGREDEIPEEHQDAFAEAFAKLYQSEEIQNLFNKADAIKADFEDKRTNDTELANVITGHVEPGDKAVVMYGAGHFKNTRAEGLDAILKDRGYAVSRVDLYETSRKIGYEPGEDLPQYVFVTDTRTSMTLKTPVAAAPVVQPATGAKAEM